MKIKTIAQGYINISRARIDLDRCRWAQAERDKHPQVYGLQDRQELLKFYLSQWPNLANDKNCRKLWSDQLDCTTESIENYIKTVEDWIKSTMGKPRRSCLPKKKQRELGLLPKL